MWNELRTKQTIGLTTAFAAIALTAGVVLFSGAQEDTTADGPATVAAEAIVGARVPKLSPARADQIVIQSPLTGLNVRVPVAEPPRGDVDLGPLERTKTIIVVSPLTGLNVRVPTN